MELNPSDFIAKRMELVSGEGAFEYFQMAQIHEKRTGRSVIYLTVGQPDFDPHKEIVQAAVHSMTKLKEHGYGVSRGEPELLEACAQYASRTREVSVSSDQIVVGFGSKMVTAHLLKAVIDSGDEVIYQNPGYPMYRSPVLLSGGKVVTVPVREENSFMIDPDELESLITKNTKVIILTSPGNPTGGVATRENLERIYALAEKYNILIYSDEVYCRIVYDNPFVSIGSLPGALERTVIIDALSKGHAMTGWRVGFAVVPTWLVEPYTRLIENSCSCLPKFIQRAAAKAFLDKDGTYEKWMTDRLAEYTERREAVVSGIRDIPGLSCCTPGGAFYVFVNISETGISAEEFVRRMLTEKDVALVPGECFGELGKGFVRISFANSMENLQEAMRRMAEFVPTI